MQSANATFRAMLATWAHHSAPWILLFFVLFTITGYALML
ncbi:hypothetical protein SAMN04489841_1116 [Natrinema salaciae]|uniref:Uncharacterized protein n=1 Tax=Natrinema salaciae TaxID=1186196 RepID=A0A1H9CR47_9EURY|nr:hypothetical protein SAMN04489841_1116 [Natrinema salaciae]